MTEMAFSIGRNRYDVNPVNYKTDDFRGMAAQVLALVAEDKARAGYVACPFGGDGSRKAQNALPCAWLALDVDHIDAEVHAAFRLYLSRFRAYGWATASSTPDAPRERVVIELSEPADRGQRIAIGALLTADVEHEFGPAVCIDACTYRPEQPCFLRIKGTRPFFLMGDSLDVRAWLKDAPPPPALPPPATADVVAMADARMRFLLQQLAAAGMLTKALANARGYAMRCPWERHHTSTDVPGATSTALLFPSEENGWRGAFRCLHAHCSNRRLGDLVAVLRRAEELSRRAAA